MSAPPKRKTLLNCEAKLRYTDDTQARAAAMLAIEHNGENQGRTELWIYRCPECNGWHLTKHRGPESMRVTAKEPVHE